MSVVSVVSVAAQSVIIRYKMSNLALVIVVAIVCLLVGWVVWALYKQLATKHKTHDKPIRHPNQPDQRDQPDQYASVLVCMHNLPGCEFAWQTVYSAFEAAARPAFVTVLIFDDFNQTTPTNLRNQTNQTNPNQTKPASVEELYKQNAKHSAGVHATQPWLRVQTVKTGWLAYFGVFVEQLRVCAGWSTTNTTKTSCIMVRSCYETPKPDYAGYMVFCKNYDVQVQMLDSQLVFSSQLVRRSLPGPAWQDTNAELMATSQGFLSWTVNKSGPIGPTGPNRLFQRANSNNSNVVYVKFNQLAKPVEQVDVFATILPSPAVHEDIVVMTSQVAKMLVSRHDSARNQPGFANQHCYQASNLAVSNLVGKLACNLLACLGCVDTSSTKILPVVQYCQAFKPSKPKLSKFLNLFNHANHAKHNTNKTNLIFLFDDFAKQVRPFSTTKKAYLGVDQRDNQHTLAIKFGSIQNFQHQLAKLSRPIQPIQPVKPNHPVQPNQPVQPIQPIQPIQPNQPVQHVQHIQPNQLTKLATTNHTNKTKQFKPTKSARSGNQPWLTRKL